MNTTLNMAELKASAHLKNRYAKQLDRLKKNSTDTKCIESAVTDATNNLAAANAAALVIYGEPQSGKTEMMICLTAKLLDAGYPARPEAKNRQ